MGLLSTAKKVATGLLDMDTPSRMARATDQGYSTDVYHGSTHNLTNMDALKTNTDSDWGQGVYSSNNIDDVNANYAGIGPDLTSRIDRRMDDIDSRIDGYEFEDLINAFPEMTEKEAKSIASGNSEMFDKFKRRLATKEIAGPNSGVVYPLKLQIKDYAVIDQKNPTRIEGRDYQAEAADDLNRSDFGSDDDYEDALYELADEMQADDYDSPLATISETLRRSGVDSDKIGEITQEFYDFDSISAFDLDKAIRSAEIYAEDELGNMIPNGAISAQVFSDLGYKGVKDNTVNAKFPTMKGMNPDTTHYITFPQNEQTIRSVNAQFDPAKSNSTSLLASRPEAAIGGLLALTAMGASEDADAGVVSSGTKAVRGLLDMDTPSRMARAKEQGFDTDNVIYHATTANFSAFDPKMAGSSTGAKDAAQGMWFADSPQATKYFGGYDDQIPTPEYSDYILSMASKRKNLEGMRDRGEISASEYFRQGRDYRAASPAEPQNKFTEGYESGSQIIPSMVRGRLKEVDASNYSPDRFLDIAKSAKSEGYDGVKFNNINDMDEASVRHSQTLIFDPSNIRSVNAAFDPAKASSSNLLASNPVATAAAGAGGLLAVTGSEDADAGVVGSGVRIAKEILNLRAQGRANEVTNEMMDAADPQYMFDNTPLPMDEASRLSRANSASASTDMYHMTDKDFNAFANPSRFGMQGKGVYVAKNPPSDMDVPNGLGDLINKKDGLFSEGTNLMPLRFTGESFDESIQRLDPFSDEGTAVLKRFGLKPNKTYSKIKGAEEGRDISEQLYDLASRQATKKHGNQRTPEWVEELKSSLNSRLKKAGFTATEDSYTGYQMAFDPKNVRSKFARFDPEFSNLKNLSASNPVATTSAGLMAMDNVGQESQGLMDAMAGRDAMLTPQEIEYLNNQRELQQLLGTQDTNKFNYADIVPMKRNKETGERSFAMTGLLRDIIEAGHNVVQSQRTGIQNQQSLWDIIL